MKTITTMKAGLAAAIAASAMIATPALATNELPTATVRYNDLDLSTQQGQDALERRLHNAAREVCGIDPRTTGFALPTAESRKCYSETIKSFEREIALRAEQQQRRG
ncbi:UrcA family protein [Aurantiacibacter poecillastricola]|uniref:UrcA family protein n=1 Tax=Aurantiacibacter poecillastricola TaxID=3064385 RepID=UPI00273F2F19|nr:UrcA family protein [Aurantiacibacter sp. 219JJ12-13]MDP5261812.1 UrcA family protein [Aurantiacibacter sp. 219JJ12-13]